MLAPHGRPRSATASNPQIDVAKAILRGYRFDKESRSILTIPYNVTVLDALKALKVFSEESSDLLTRTRMKSLISEETLKSLESGRSQSDNTCQLNYGVPRTIIITACVKDTEKFPYLDRNQQADVLQSAHLGFSDPIHQALACAAHFLSHNCDDIFKSHRARGSVPGFTVELNPTFGIRYVETKDKAIPWCCASGSPLLPA